MAVLRTLIGQALRATRLRQDRTLREVSTAARVSLGYLSEVERGQKEASSELLASICRALGVRLSDVLRDVSESLSALEPELVTTGPVAVPPLADQHGGQRGEQRAEQRGGRLDREQLAGEQQHDAERQAEPVALASHAGVTSPVVAAA